VARGPSRRRIWIIIESRGRMASVIVLLAPVVFLLVLVRLRSDTSRSAVGMPPGEPGPEASALDWARWGSNELRHYRLGSATRAFARARQLDSRLIQARLGLIWVHALRMERDAALAEFAAMSDVCTLDFDQVLLWTQIRCSSWDPEKVVSQLQALLEADPGDRGVRLTLAEGLRRLGRQVDALEVLAVLLASDGQAQAIRARIALDRGEPAAAQAILAKSPDDYSELAELRGELALIRRDGPTAVAEFRRALAVQPDDRHCINGLAQALRFTGQDQTALPLLKAVERHDALIELVRRASEMIHRNDHKLMCALGAACETLQLTLEARAWYSLALARDPLNSEIQIALYRLRTQRPVPSP
jgi:thioredoxin-like negative regulator of GroEL